MMALDLHVVRSLVEEAIDLNRLRRGHQRQQRIAERKVPDYAPLLLGHTENTIGNSKDNRSYKLGDHVLCGGYHVPELENYPHVHLARQVIDPEAMLYEALWELLSWARTPSDAQLSVRPNLVCILPTCFGMKYHLNDEGAAWFSERITIDQALDTDLDDIQNLGDIPLVLEHLQYFKENLPDGVEIECPLAVGPLTLADCILGESIWISFYENPEKLHRLIEHITDAIIRLLALYKQVIGESIGTLRTGPLYLSSGGVKVSNDSMVMLSPEMFGDFIRPANCKLYKAFCGGYHHSCGYYPDHLDVLCQTQDLTVINFGQPELWDMPDAVNRIFQSGKFYYGGWQRLPGEPIEEYLRRGVELCGPQRNRAILFAKGPGPWPDPVQTMDLWYYLQDTVYPP